MRFPQWIEVDAAALRHNLGVFRSLLDASAQLLAVVKANAYGHGLEQVAPVAVQSAQWLGVHTAEEARRVRGLGLRQPVLVMGFVPPGELHDLDRDVHVVVSSVETLEWLGDYRRASGVSLPVHLKVDTGTKRQGVAVEKLPRLCDEARRQRLDVVGAATHFANIEDTLEHGFARHQLEVFHLALETLRTSLGGDPPYVHAACSAAALLFPETHFAMARIGISMYGHWPSRETHLSWVLAHGRDGVTLRPALTWKSLVGQLQEAAKGETVGYGRTWTALRRTLLAVIPVGYADGYSRILGNRARVLVKGVPVPVIGRVCMNIMMLDVTDVPDVATGDEVVLLGSQDGATVSAEELASLSGTINYELLARISSLIPRVVVNDSSAG